MNEIKITTSNKINRSSSLVLRIRRQVDVYELRSGEV
jgi:hypothetical protein